MLRARLVPFGLTSAAMLAFAANSLLCRLALGTEAIDPWSFTAVRIGTGALALLALVGRRELPQGARGSWRQAGYLMLYALPFSLAYVRLDAGVGALLLFGAVQITMLVQGLRAGERPGPLEWAALVGASGGLAYLVLPGVAAPDPSAAVLMLAAGLGWGLYSIAGKRSGHPLGATAGAFGRSALVLVPLTALGWGALSATAEGLFLATVSGALTSGVGYVVWYAALEHLASARAALVQLSVPVLAAIGGVALLAEPITPRLAVAGVVILGSIAMGVVGGRT